MLLSVKLDLPKEVYDAYESQGPLEKVLATRLIQSVDHTSKKPIYIPDDIRQRLDKILGRNLSGPEDLLHAVEQIVCISISDVKVPLHPTLLKRLRTRCFGMQFEDFLADQTVKSLEEFAGMR